MQQMIYVSTLVQETDFCAAAVAVSASSSLSGRLNNHKTSSVSELCKTEKLGWYYVCPTVLKVNYTRPT